jgi:hypothetical protein
MGDTSEFDFAFFWVGNDVSLPELLLRSAREFFPETEIHHLTDGKTPEIDGTRCHRFALSSYLMLARCEAMAQFPLERPTAFLDADVLFIDKFELPALGERDVLAIKREKDLLMNHNWPEPYPEFAGRNIMSLMPWQFCFIYTRCAAFLRELPTRLKGKPDRFLRWYGDQIVLKEVFDTGTYNFLPARPVEFAHDIKTTRTRNEIKDLRKVHKTKIVLVKGPNVEKARVLGKTLDAMTYQA